MSTYANSVQVTFKSTISIIMKKQTGVWLDFSSADIIHLEEEEVKAINISSQIEDYHVVGGSHSKSPWGPVDTVSEGKSLERRKHQAEKYFAEIYKAIADRDEIFILGPAEAKIGLKTYLSGIKSLKAQILDVQSADSISLNQKIAAVRSFFSIK